MDTSHYQIMKRTDDYGDGHTEDWYGIYEYHTFQTGIFYEETPLFEEESVEELLRMIWRIYSDARKNGVKVHEG